MAPRKQTRPTKKLSGKKAATKTTKAAPEAITKVTPTTTSESGPRLTPKRVYTAEEKRLKVWLAANYFKKGQSGNPSGRPKKKPISDRYREALEVELPDEIRKTLGMHKGATMGDALARRMTIRAIEGRNAVDAAREIREAVEGKAPSASEARASTPMKVRVVYEGADGRLGVSVDGEELPANEELKDMN